MRPELDEGFFPVIAANVTRQSSPDCLQFPARVPGDEPAKCSVAEPQVGYRQTTKSKRQFQAATGRSRPPRSHLQASAPWPRSAPFLGGTARPLVLILVAAVIPILLLAAWMGFRSATQQREAALDRARVTVGRVGEQITSEISAEIQVAETLALSSALASGDLANFYGEAQRLRSIRPLWYTIELDDPSGIQRFNLLRPFGEALGATADRTSFDKASASHQPVVGGIGPVGPVSGKQLVVIRVPVMVAGVLRYIVTVALNPSAVSTILRETAIPIGWVGAVVDRNGTLIARSLADQESLGQPAGPALRAAIATSGSGFYPGTTREGVPVEVVFRALQDTGGWSVHLGLPSQALNGPVRRALYAVAGGVLGSLALAFGLTTAVARGLAQQRRDDERRSDAALAASEERASLAAEAAELGTWGWDVQRDRVTGSERCRSLLALPSTTEDHPYWSSGAFLEAVHADDRDAIRAAAQACRRGNHAFDIEFRTLAQDSQIRWRRASGRAASGNEQVYGIVADIGLQKRAAAERLTLQRRLAEAQENVQRRIARDLHDQVGQTVTGLSLGLKGLERSLDGPEAVATLGSRSDLQETVRWLQNLAGEIGRDIHRASVDLRPTALDDLGLPGALGALVGEWGERYGVQVDVQVLGGTEPRLPAETETVVYRVVQEALTNVLKHAHAGIVSIVFERRTDEIRVVVEDDGLGFDVSGSDRPTDIGLPEHRAHLGLTGIRERLTMIGGTLRIESSPGTGTALFIAIALDPDLPPGTNVDVSRI